MNEKDHRNERSLFYGSSSEQPEDQQDKQADDINDRPAYYSYGSYKSERFQNQEEFAADAGTNQESVNEAASDAQESAEDHAFETKMAAVDSTQTVEITHPSPVKPIYHDPSHAGIKQKNRTSSFRSMFASFLAGAAVVALFMFVAVQMNLFAADEGQLGGILPSGSEQSVESSSGGVSAAAADPLVRPATISDMVKMAGPAVVKIETMVKQNTRTRFNDDIFRWFFGDQYLVPRQEEGQLVPGGMGSGFIFEKTGYIYTNQHVIDRAEEIWVEVQGYPEKFKAELLGSDYEMDLAVLKIEGDEFPALKMGDSSSVEVGDWVTAIGNPIGFDHTVSVGVLSAKEREISIQDETGMRGPRKYQNLLQTDASINPGNSGGPLLNLNGEVIGMNTAVSANAQGIGFAIPSNTLLEVVDRLKNGEKIEKPFIGVTLAELNDRLAEQLGLDSSDGVVVMQVLRDSPANLAGLRPYDVIVEFNGEKVENIEHLQSKIREAGTGARVTVTFIRDGSRYDTGLIIGDRNDIS